MKLFMNLKKWEILFFIPTSHSFANGISGLVGSTNEIVLSEG